MNTTGIDVQESNERLLKALFSNRGLTYLVEVGAAELGNPVLVVDPTYHYAARATSTTPRRRTSSPGSSAWAAS